MRILSGSIKGWRGGVALGLCGAMILFPGLILPGLIGSFLAFLSRANRRRPPQAVRILRTAFILLGLVSTPFFRFSLLMDQIVRIEGGGPAPAADWAVFLICERIYLTAVLPVLCYVTAYLLSILDPAALLLPLIFLPAALILLGIGWSISPTYFTPLIPIIVLLLCGHAAITARAGIRRRFRWEQRAPWGRWVFHYLDAILGFFVFFFSWDLVHRMDLFVRWEDLRFLPAQIVAAALYGAGCLALSSLVLEESPWARRVPVLLLPLTAFLPGGILYVTLAFLHILYFRPGGLRRERKGL